MKARRLGLVVGGVVLVAGGAIAGAAALSSDPAPARPPRDEVSDQQQTPAPDDRTYGIGRRDLELVDTTRSTDADPNRGREAQPDRTIPTIVLYPIDETAADAPPQVDAPAAEGSFPLVVFSHGYSASGEVYAPLVEPLVREGYVVALPTFPLSSGAVGVLGDYVNQPGDVSFVIDELFDLSREDGGWLADRVDRHHVAAAGHSLGAVTTLGVVHDSCCIDDRIDAAVSIAGGPLDFPAGEYTWPDTPTLLIHGAADTVAPIAGSDIVFDRAAGPMWYLRFTEADHFSVGLGDDGALTFQVITAFLDAELKGQPDELDAMPEVIATSGRAEWQVKPPP